MRAMGSGKAKIAWTVFAVFLCCGCGEKKFGDEVCQAAAGINPSDSTDEKRSQLFLNYLKINPNPSRWDDERLRIMMTIQQVDDYKVVASLMDGMGVKDWTCPEYQRAFPEKK